MPVTCCNVLWSILTISAKLVTVSMQVSALNLKVLPFTWTFQGPIRSTATSSNGCSLNSRFVHCHLVYGYGVDSQSICTRLCTCAHLGDSISVLELLYLFVTWMSCAMWNHFIVDLIMLFGNAIHHFVL